MTLHHAVLALLLFVATAVANAGTEIVLHTSNYVRASGNWQVVNDLAAASGRYLRNGNQGAAKISSPSSNPSDFFEVNFYANAGVGYRVWFRMKAESDYYGNDSVYAQFTESEDASGNAIYRIGSSSATAFVLEECSGAGLSNWGWNNSSGWCGDQELIYFSTSGLQTIRVQAREDGIGIDQIVLSASTYSSSAPGGLKDDTRRLPANDGSEAPVATPTPVPTPAPTPTPVPPSGISSRIKVLQWNNEGDNAAEIDLIVAEKPQVVFMQEVDYPSHVTNIKNALADDQGGTWYQYEIGKNNTRSSHSWVVIISKFQLSNIKTLPLRYQDERVSCDGGSATVDARTAVGATINVNSKPLAIFSVRLTYHSSLRCIPQQEALKLKSWAQSNYGSYTHIYGGDFNFIYGDKAYNSMRSDSYAVQDTWLEAIRLGVASAWTTVGTNTGTKSNRLDYIFVKPGPTLLSVVSSRIPPYTGYSDHRMMMTTFDVR